MTNIACQLEHSVEAEVTPSFAWNWRTDIKNWDDPPAQFQLDGPFAKGSWGTTRLPGQEPMRWQIRDVRPGTSFTIEMSLDRAVLRFEWVFDALSNRRTRITQRIVLSGDNAAAYADQVRAGFGSTLPDGMKRTADALVRAERSMEGGKYTAMLLGATGNVGGHILRILVQSPLCKKVVVVTRRNVAEFANPKVQQVVVNMDKLEAELTPHAKGVDIALAAFGVGKGSAKMADEEVRKIEITYPTAFASAAKAGGARVLAMMTAAGADSQSSTKYLRNIGDKEKKSEELKFDFLGLYRPAVILGNSNTPSALGVVMPLFHWAMPSRYHSIHKNDLARAMVAQSEQAFLALAQGKGPAAPAVKILEYREMEPFFVAGDSDAP
jgi:uncharacterized protein YbjT (DUF2867 family)